MDLEETEERNDCAGEGQQQFNRPIELVSQSRVSVAEAGTVREPRGKGTSAFGSRYQESDEGTAG
jgi:hypothetical protein